MKTKFSLRRIAISLALILAVVLLIYDPFIILLHIYWFFLISVIAGIMKFSRHRGPPGKLSLAAVISGCCATLNPFIADFLVRLTGLPSIFGDSEIESFCVALLAVISGHVALFRIKRAAPLLRGRTLAWTGLVLGYLSMVAWIGVLLMFAWHMAQWK